MADQQPATERQRLRRERQRPQVSILAQYVKDLSVENPSLRRSSLAGPAAASTSSSTSASTQPRDEVHEVTLKIDVSARSDNGVHFVVDLSYAGLFGLRNVPDRSAPPFLLIEAPRLLFPFARQIIAEAISNPASRRSCSTRSTSPRPIWRRSRPQQQAATATAASRRRKVGQA